MINRYIENTNSLTSKASLFPARPQTELVLDIKISKINATFSPNLSKTSPSGPASIPTRGSTIPKMDVYLRIRYVIIMSSTIHFLSCACFNTFHFLCQKGVIGIVVGRMRGRNLTSKQEKLLRAPKPSSGWL